MYIEVNVPYEPGKKLGESMNRTMEHVKDWVLFIDHDVLIMTPQWYNTCLSVIKQVGYQAGWITCKTNRIGCHWQRIDIKIQDTDDLSYHARIAKDLYKTKGDSYFEPEEYAPFSGFFLLTHKEAWKKVGGFESGWLVDNPYDMAIRKAGYKRYVMQGIYCYHVYRKKGEWFND